MRCIATTPILIAMLDLGPTASASRSRATHLPWLRRHYVALVALFVALGGTSYAAIAARNSVSSRSIRTAAVKSSDVKDEALKGVDVDEGSLDFGGLKELVGPPGERGETGPIGPTFATVLANPQAIAPPATPDTAIVNGQYTHTFTTPASGRLLVFASLQQLGVACTFGPGHAFLYLDGVGVPGSGSRQMPEPTLPFDSMALTGIVPAGQHTLNISADCPGGQPSGDTSSRDGKLGAILIGG
jgi:hypothetical protein